MAFQQLLKANTWLTISSKFSEIYPEAEQSMDGYKALFEKLVVMSSEEIDLTIVITREKDEDEEYIDVSSLHNNPKNKEETYAQGIELTPWCKWLGMTISKESLDDFSELEIIVHCLYEMTFMGFSEKDIQKTFSHKKQQSWLTV